MAPNTHTTGEKGKDRKSDTLDTLIDVHVNVGQLSTLAERRTIKRAERRLSRRAAKIIVWWSKLPKPRPTYLRPATLERSLGMSLQRAAASLRWLRWQRITPRMNGKPTTLWIPPGSPITKRPIGRPRIYPCD